jgi:hypothetical protein
MHASFRVGGVPLMASDGCDDTSKFNGYRLSLANEIDAKRAFDALAVGVEICARRGGWPTCSGALPPRLCAAFSSDPCKAKRAIGGNTPRAGEIFRESQVVWSHEVRSGRRVPWRRPAGVPCTVQDPRWRALHCARPPRGRALHCARPRAAGRPRTSRKTNPFPFRPLARLARCKTSCRRTARTSRKTNPFPFRQDGPRLRYGVGGWR